MSIVSRWWANQRAARSLPRDSEGSALVEGAVIVPLLIVLLLGVYEFSWFFYQQHVISSGLRDAARYLARSHDSCGSGPANWAAVEESAKNLAVRGSITGGFSRVKGWAPVMVTLRCHQIDNLPPASGLAAYRGGSVVYVITASTQFIEPSLGFFGLLGLPLPVISVAHSERVIGPG
jgi:TadE-like protein